MGREIVSHKSPGLNDMLFINAMDEPDHEIGGGACHRYRVGHIDKEGFVKNGAATMEFVDIEFQRGPAKEYGINGITEEALLAIIRDRLLYFQTGKFACQHNKAALQHVESAMDFLHRRTRDRDERGVEGKNEE